MATPLSPLSKERGRADGYHRFRASFGLVQQLCRRCTHVWVVKARLHVRLNHNVCLFLALCCPLHLVGALLLTSPLGRFLLQTAGAISGVSQPVTCMIYRSKCSSNCTKGCVLVRLGLPGKPSHLQALDGSCKRKRNGTAWKETPCLTAAIGTEGRRTPGYKQSTSTHVHTSSCSISKNRAVAMRTHASHPHP